MTHLSSFEICVAVIVLAAAATDIRSRRIPNWLTMSGVVAGLVLHAWAGGARGFAVSLEGMLLGFGCYLALYCLRAMGAGDVKLMAAVGAILGPSEWMSVFLATAIAGGVLALILIVVKGRLKYTLFNILFIVNELSHLRHPQRKRGDLDVRDPRSLKMPHGVAIAAGTAVCFLLALI